MNYADYVKVMKALSDETRLYIIDMLSCGEMCACEILKLVKISQSTLSYHMNILMDCGIINGVKDGSWMLYSINKDNTELLLSFLYNITHEKTECVCKNKGKENI